MRRCARGLARSHLSFHVHNRVGPRIKLVRSYISPNSQRETSDLDVEENETSLRLRQVTYNARTLVRARRHEDAAKVIDDGLELSPWHSSLWFWKLATKIGNSRGAIEVWDTMSRLGVRKFPEHYDIMANAVAHTSARHIILELYEDLKRQQLSGNAKFYSQLFAVCRDRAVYGNPLSKVEEIWQEMGATSNLRHIVNDPNVMATYQETIDLLRRASNPVTRPLPLPSITNNEAVASSDTVSYSMQDTISTEKFAKSAEVSVITPQIIPPEVTHVEPTAVTDAATKQDGVGSSNELDTSRSTTDFEPDNVVPMAATSSQSSRIAASETMRSMRDTLEPFFQPKSNVRKHKSSLQKARKFLQSSPAVDIPTYNYIIRSAARISQPGALLNILEEAVDRGLKPDSGTYNPIVRSFFRAGQPDEALDLIDRMEVSNVKFDFGTIYEVLRGLLNSKRDDAAISFFVDVFQSGAETSLMPGKDGQVSCFSLMIEGLTECGRMEDAQKLLSVMVQHELNPTLTIYNTLIRAAFFQNQVLDAMKYYALAINTPDLKRTNIDWCADMDELASTVVAGYLITKHHEEAELFLKDAVAKDLWHDTTPKPYISFLKWYAKHERLDDAWSLFEFHKDRFDAQGTYKLQAAVLSAIFLDRGDIYGGMQWIRQLQQRGTVIEQSQYVEMISAAMFNGEREVGEQMWEEVVDSAARRGQDPIPSLTRLGKQWGFTMTTGEAEAKAKG